MHHSRRTNENNVDLNRNAILDWIDDVDRLHLNQRVYHQFDALFNPRPLPMYYSLSILLKMLWAVAKHGSAAVKAVMVGGQYSDPTGIFFGGTETQNSTRLVQEWLENCLEDSSFSYFTWLDVYTGLGPFAKDTMIPKSKEMVQTTKLKFPNAFCADDNTVSQGYERVQGLYGPFFTKTLAQHTGNPLFVVQEFGTVPALFVGLALITEKAQHHAPPRALPQQLLRVSFYPDNQHWRDEVYNEGLRLLCSYASDTPF
jgi:hypothetical protein